MGGDKRLISSACTGAERPSAKIAAIAKRIVSPFSRRPWPLFLGKDYRENRPGKKSQDRMDRIPAGNLTVARTRRIILPRADRAAGTDGPWDQGPATGPR